MPYLPGALASDDSFFDRRDIQDAARLGTTQAESPDVIKSRGNLREDVSRLNAVDERRRERSQKRILEREMMGLSSESLDVRALAGGSKGNNNNYNININNNNNNNNNDNNNSSSNGNDINNNGLIGINEHSSSTGDTMQDGEDGAQLRARQSLKKGRMTARGRNSSRKPGNPGNLDIGIIPQLAKRPGESALPTRHDGGSKSARRARFADSRGGSSSQSMLGSHLALPLPRGSTSASLLNDHAWIHSAEAAARAPSRSMSRLSARRHRVEDGDGDGRGGGVSARSTGANVAWDAGAKSPSGVKLKQINNKYTSDTSAKSEEYSRGDDTRRKLVGGADGGDADDAKSESSEGSIDEETANYFMFLDITEGSRRRSCDLAFAFAVASIVAMIATIEMRYHMPKDDLKNNLGFVNLGKMAVSVLTLLTMLNVWRYHALEFRLLKHRHILPAEMSMWQSPTMKLLLMELFVIALHPIPFFEGTYQVAGAEIEDDLPRPTTSQQGTITPSHPVPTDVLGVIVFVRVYLVLRVLKFHGALYGPAARFIGALNNVDFDLRFMLKALVNNHPFRVLGTSLVYVLFAVAYAIWVIERERDQYFFIDDSLWFLIVTMTTVGFGDIIPTNHLSRILTVVAAVAGVTVTALLVAVMSSKLTLSKGEARVVHLLNKDRLRRELYHRAAKVIQAAARYSLERRKNMSVTGCKVRLFKVLRTWRLFKRHLNVYMTDNVASRDMALDDVMVEIVRLSGITEVIEDQFEIFGEKIDDLRIVTNTLSRAGSAIPPEVGDETYSNNVPVNRGFSGPIGMPDTTANAKVDQRLEELDHRAKVLTTAVTKTLRKIEAVEHEIGAVVEERVAARTAELGGKVDTLIDLVKAQQQTMQEMQRQQQQMVSMGISSGDTVMF